MNEPTECANTTVVIDLDICILQLRVPQPTFEIYSFSQNDISHIFCIHVCFKSYQKPPLLQVQ